MQIIVVCRKCKWFNSSWKNTHPIKIQSIYRQSRTTSNDKKIHTLQKCTMYMHWSDQNMQICSSNLVFCSFTNAFVRYSLYSLCNYLHCRHVFLTIFFHKYVHCMHRYVLEVCSHHDDLITKVMGKYPYG